MPQREPRTTWLSPEEHAYPHGGQTRKGAAIFPDGKIRTVYAGIPDTYFSIPAHARINGWYVSGFLTINYEKAIFGEYRYFFTLNSMQGRKKNIPAINVFPTMYPKKGD